MKDFLKAIFSMALGILLAHFGIVVPPLPKLPPITPPAPAPTVPPGGGEIPIPGPNPAPKPSADPLAAIGSIQFGNAGCSATIIGPRLADGRWHALTAAHCVKDVGQRGNMKLRDGRSLPLVVLAFDRKADCCWLLVDSTASDLPFALLIDSAPAGGAAVWHAGYGVDKPANREEGVFVRGADENGQVQFTLNVSNGDSGGAIVDAVSGRVVSCVCCSAGVGRKSSVWGAGPDAIRKLRPGGVSVEQEPAVPVELAPPPRL